MLLDQKNRQLLMWMSLLILPILAWMSRSQGGLYNKPVATTLDEQQLKSMLEAKEILVVGGTEGIGAELVRSLDKRGSYVTVTGADDSNVKYLPKGIHFFKGNLSTMRGAEDLVKRTLHGRTFDTVVFCGGFVPRPILTGRVENFVEDLETSYLSRFIVLKELIKQKAFVGRKRIYLLGHPGDDPMLSQFEDMWFDWSDYKEIPRYVNTLLFNDALVKEVAKRYPDLAVFGVNPGFMSRGAASDVLPVTKDWISFGIEHLASLAMKSPHQYVERTLIHLIASPDLQTKSGIYISDSMFELPMKKWFANERNREAVWDHSETLVFKALG